MTSGSWFWRLIAAAIAALMVAGCSTAEPPDPTLGWTPERLYEDARDDMQGGRWDAAIKTLEKMEKRNKLEGLLGGVFLFFHNIFSCGYQQFY